MMTFPHPFGRHIGFLEGSLALVVLLGLAVPFLPIPREHSTRIAVRFQTADMPRPNSFTVHTSSHICHVLAALLSYQDPDSGEFMQITCGKKAEALAPQIRTERADAAATAASAQTQP